GPEQGRITAAILGILAVLAAAAAYFLLG
ncbi:MAG: hypothetical protein H6R40_899, partial [Gemmatimonadetes bacterium]|nr:hypothetical protein [Gemmatimonadota bacterium]